MAVLFLSFFCMFSVKVGMYGRLVVYVASFSVFVFGPNSWLRFMLMKIFSFAAVMTSLANSCG